MDSGIGGNTAQSLLEEVISPALHMQAFIEPVLQYHSIQPGGYRLRIHVSTKLAAGLTGIDKPDGYGAEFTIQVFQSPRQLASTN
jgi:hypothetical protein